MDRDVQNPEYWKTRLYEASEAHEPHRALYITDRDTWANLEMYHRGILAHHIKPGDRILDAGCGWGRLLTLLPTSWYTQVGQGHSGTHRSGYRGNYYGIDISPDFIAKAKETNANQIMVQFQVGSLLELPKHWEREGFKEFDWAIAIAVRSMITNYVGKDVWEAMQRNILEVSKRLLVLSYDFDTYEVIECEK